MGKEGACARFTRQKKILPGKLFLSELKVHLGTKPSVDEQCLVLGPALLMISLTDGEAKGGF